MIRVTEMSLYSNGRPAREKEIEGVLDGYGRVYGRDVSRYIRALWMMVG